MEIKEVFIQSETGYLEGKINLPEVAINQGVVLCHHHPLHKGNLEHSVTAGLAQIFAEMGYHALRFNFRGVGMSSGIYDNDIGELKDVDSALTHLKSNYQELSSLHLAGYSYGCYIGTQFLQIHQEIKTFTMVAPPLTIYNFSSLKAFPGSVFMIFGDKDQYTPKKQVDQIVAQLGKESNWIVLENTDQHFLGKIKKIKLFMKEQLDAIEIK